MATLDELLGWPDRNDWDEIQRQKRSPGAQSIGSQHTAMGTIKVARCRGASQIDGVNQYHQKLLVLHSVTNRIIVTVSLDPQLRALLGAVRRRIRQYIVVDSLLAIAALVLMAFWLGLAIDFLPVRLGGTEMPRSARTILLVGVGLAVMVLVVKLLANRLRKPLRDDSLAILVERHHPELAGRLVTAVQLTQPNRTSDSHEPALLQKVHDDAVAVVDQIEPRRIFRFQPLWRKAWVVGPLGIALIAFAVVSPSAFGRAAGRLLLLSDSPWPRQAALAMVGVELPSVTADENESGVAELVEFVDLTMRLPQGSSGALRVLASAEGAVVPDVCTVYYVTDDGNRGQANMRRVGRVVDGQQAFILDGPPLAGLSESVRISVRGLDSRLDDYYIEAVPPPAITSMKVVTSDPAYLQPRGDDTQTAQGSPARQTDYQSGLRIREGSQVQLVGESTVPLGAVDVRLVRGNEVAEQVVAEIEQDASGFRIRIDDMRKPATIVVVPRDKTGITAQLPYRYFLGVVIDDEPEIAMRLRGIGTAITPIAKLPVAGKVTDDYEIDMAKLELGIVAPAPADDATVEPKESGIAKLEQAAPGTTTAEPIRADRDGNFEMLLDLRELAEQARLVLPEIEGNQAGGAINLIGEVSDRYDLQGSHQVKSELFRLEIVTADRLLALLERRELALRARLEQAIDETRGLRDSLDLLRREADQPVNATATIAQTEPAAIEDVRREQILRLRAQQNGLQASKTSDELSGIAASLDDLLEEMQNNRVDSVDRRERIGSGVRDPLRAIVAGDLAKLIRQIGDAESNAAEPIAVAEKTGQAVQTAEDVLLQLTAVLEKMLDLESFNEILDMFRELIESQDGLLDETKKEQKRKTLELFD